MGSLVVPRFINSLKELEYIKKDHFTSQYGIFNDDEDKDKYVLILRSQRWWLEYSSYSDSLTFNFYAGWHVPCELLRFANELFVEQDDLKEVHIVWDKPTHRYFLKRDISDNSDEIPIVRLFKEFPEKEPLGIWGVCKRPAVLEDPYQYYGVYLYKTLGTITERISDSAIF